MTFSLTKTAMTNLKLAGTLPSTRRDCPLEVIPRREWRDKTQQTYKKIEKLRQAALVKQRKEAQEAYKEKERFLTLSTSRFRQTRPAVVHSPEHLAEVKQRRLQQEKLRTQQLLLEQRIKENRPPPKSRHVILRQDHDKQQSAIERRQVMTKIQEDRLKYELENKEVQAKLRLKEKDNLKKTKNQDLISKNKKLQEENKIRRNALEKEERDIIEKQVAFKEIRTLQNLRVKPQPKIERKRLIPIAKGEPIAEEQITQILLSQFMDFTALLDETENVYDDNNDNLFVSEERKTREWIESGFDDKILDPNFNEDDFIFDMKEKQRNRFIEPISKILQDLNIDTDANKISKQLVFYADYLKHLKVGSEDCAGDSVDWFKWQEEVEGRVRPIPDWQVRALDQNRLAKSNCIDPLNTDNQEHKS